MARRDDLVVIECALQRRPFEAARGAAADDARRNRRGHDPLPRRGREHLPRARPHPPRDHAGRARADRGRDLSQGARAAPRCAALSGHHVGRDAPGALEHPRGSRARRSRQDRLRRSGLDQPRRARRGRSAGADQLRLRAQLRRHPLVVRRVRAAAARAESVDLRAGLPPGGARLRARRPTARGRLRALLFRRRRVSHRAARAVLVRDAAAPAVSRGLSGDARARSALPWFVAVLAGDVVGSGMARAALEGGGHVRVGLEDAAGARDCSNAELVEEVVALAHEVGRRVATPAETAKLFGFPRT